MPKLRCAILFIIITDCCGLRPGGKSSGPSEANDPKGAFDPVDPKRGYYILTRLAQRGGGVDLRGIGKCQGILYMFFNKPALYIGENEIAYNPATKQFMLLSLDPTRVFFYSTNTKLLSYVCGKREVCESLLDDIYLAAFAYNGRCNMFVVDTRNGNEEPYHKFAVFDLSKELQFLKEEDFTGMKGIPFSQCSASAPYFRFLYYADIHMSRSDCEIHYLRNHYGSIDDCYRDLADQGSIPVGKQLVMTADDSVMNKDVVFHVKEYKRVLWGKYRYGGCIDNRYIVVQQDNVMVFKEYIENNKVYNFFGYQFVTFAKEERVTEMEVFFNIVIPSPGGPKPNKPAAEKKDNTTANATESAKVETALSEIVTALVITLYTDEPPAVTDAAFTGMPLRSRTAFVTVRRRLIQYLEDENIQRYGIITAIILVLVCIFCCLCLMCFFITMKRGRRSNHRPPPPKPENIVVQIAPQKASKKHTPTRRK